MSLLNLPLQTKILKLSLFKKILNCETQISNQSVETNLTQTKNKTKIKIS